MADGSIKVNLVTAQGSSEVRITSKAKTFTERRWGNKAFEEHPFDALHYSTWVSVGMPGGSDGYDGWLDTIEDVVPVMDPTEAATPSEPSPPSLPQPEYPLTTSSSSTSANSTT